MREGLRTIQQTLTPEAASVLSHSIAEAGRRNHGQTTPLHVAATLLASPSGYLRQACIRSHPDSSHPLQSRALELCFSVALERLPAAQSMEGPGMEPPISNALMAALKRAQAHQRRGCPEQQQQPLLAVKVELEQLVISILDDPGVSRVMREASFSSPAVKAAIEKTLINFNSNAHAGNANFGGIGPKLLPNSARLAPPPLQSSQIPNRNVYLNPRLQQGEELRKVFDVMSRRKKRNPIMVGDSDPNSMVKEFLRKIVNKEFVRDGDFKNVEVVSMETWKMEELGGVIESKMKNGGVILDLGDLKWLVEQPLSLGGAAVVVEMKKLLARFGGGERGCKLWLIGAANCETYLRCQVYHSSMEDDWDLQAVPISSPSPLPEMFPRFGSGRILSKPVESSCPLKAITTPLPALTKHAPEFLGAAQRSSLCPQCSESYEKELAKLGAIEKSFSEAKQASPPWLQIAKANDESQSKDPWLLSKKKAPDLQKKWRDTCLNLHQNRTAPPPLSMSSLYNPNLLSRTPFQQLAKPLGAALLLNTNRGASRALELHPTSPVRTDLNLGWKGADDVSSEPPTKLFANALDVDTYKKLLKGLMEKAWWQAAAASAVASAIARCRLGNGKRRGAGTRGDVWLLFAGPDRVGKKKMAAVIGEQVFGVSPVVICLGKRRGDRDESDVSSRGKTSIDRITEAVRRNPFLVMVLEDIDEADMVVRGSIKRAMERGRLTDSHGREVGLGNAIFIVTGDWSISRIDLVTDGRFVDETKLASVASGGWQLGLIVRDNKTGVKRRPSRLHDEDDADRPSKPRREMGAGLSLDLNLTAGFIDDEKTDGSNNSSDLTIDHDDEELGLVDPHDLASNADAAVVFKPVSSAFVRWEIKKAISAEFSVAVDENMSIEVEDEVLDRILGGLWHDRSSLKEWMEKVVVPSFDQLKTRLPSADRSSSVVRLVMESDSVDRGRKHGNAAAAEWLPSSIHV